MRERRGFGGGRDIEREIHGEKGIYTYNEKEKESEREIQRESEREEGVWRG